MSAKYNGELQLYLGGVEQVVMDCQAGMNPMLLLILIEPQLRACKVTMSGFGGLSVESVAQRHLFPSKAPTDGPHGS